MPTWKGWIVVKTAHVVIGAGFGDEGKGLITDYLASHNSGTVVRFNGGAQAGHTVDDPRKGRHVFHHFGSATLRGYQTYLSSHFISNPMMANQEYDELVGRGVIPVISAHKSGAVTTVYDMMINQMAEEARGSHRHGSCGLGINETIQRNTKSELRTLISDLADPAMMAGRLARIRSEWLPARLEELSIKVSDKWSSRINSDDILRASIANMEKFYALLTQMDNNKINTQPSGHEAENIIFEGAQGLLLDEDHRFFPHVTHSKTGIQNVLPLIGENSIDHLMIVYVMRAYATRHGAGPFPFETPAIQYPDPTNVPNEWQGNLRFGLLNLDLINEAVRQDIPHAYTREFDDVIVVPNIALTCMDQVPDTVQVVWENEIHSVKKKYLPDFIEGALKIIVRYVSYGPTRETIDDRYAW